MPRSRNAKRGASRDSFGPETWPESRRQPLEPAQPTLPFAADDALALGGMAAMGAARKQLQERRAMTSTCTCAHKRDQHTGTKLVCAVAGCPCSRFRR